MENPLGSLAMIEQFELSVAQGIATQPQMTPNPSEQDAVRNLEDLVPVIGNSPESESEFEPDLH